MVWSGGGRGSGRILSCSSFALFSCKKEKCLNLFQGIRRPDLSTLGGPWPEIYPHCQLFKVKVRFPRCFSLIKSCVAPVARDVCFPLSAALNSSVHVALFLLVSQTWAW